ncbi:hypothetical protein FB107DRAFT_276291 [Schizophyllum commune]
MLGAASCWYARSVYEVLKAKFGGREEATRYASDRGTYMSRTLVHDDLRFDFSQLSSDALHKSVIRLYPQRIGWLWNTSTHDSAPSPACPGRQAFIRPVEEFIEGLDNIKSKKLVRELEEVIKRLGEECRMIDEAEQGMPQRSREALKSLQEVARRLAEEAQGLDEGEQEKGQETEPPSEGLNG